MPFASPSIRRAVSLTPLAFAAASNFHRFYRIGLVPLTTEPMLGAHNVEDEQLPARAESKATMIIQPAPPRIRSALTVSRRPRSDPEFQVTMTEACAKSEVDV